MPFTDADGFQSEMQARCCRVDCHCFDVATEIARKFDFEFARVRAGGQPAGFHGLGDGFDFFVPDIGQGERDKWIHGWPDTILRCDAGAYSRTQASLLIFDESRICLWNRGEKPRNFLMCISAQGQIVRGLRFQTSFY
ncbi:hypothetical protein D3C71_1624160 [compost metagenome]